MSTEARSHGVRLLLALALLLLFIAAIAGMTKDSYSRFPYGEYSFPLGVLGFLCLVVSIVLYATKKTQESNNYS